VTINKDRLRLGLEALRGGEYRQTLQALCKQDDQGNRSFCCLGVLTDVAIKNGLVGLTERVNRDGVTVGYLAEGARHPETGLLPPSVARWYGLPHVGPKLLPTAEQYEEFGLVHGEQYEATELNDDLGMDFVQIADTFENTYLKEDSWRSTRSV
jgi:hypothetical protein